jgi:hypothetical protein
VPIAAVDAVGAVAGLNEAFASVMRDLAAWAAANASPAAQPEPVQ